MCGRTCWCRMTVRTAQSSSSADRREAGRLCSRWRSQRWQAGRRRRVASVERGGHVKLPAGQHYAAGVEVVAYHELAGRPAFKLALQVVNHNLLASLKMKSILYLPKS